MIVGKYSFLVFALCCFYSNHLLAIECQTQPEKATVFTFLDVASKENESFFQGLYCDLTPWNWGKIDLTYTESDTWPSSFHTSPDTIDRYTVKSRGISVSRGYGSTMTLFGIDGVDFEYLDFTAEKKIALVNKNINLMETGWISKSDNALNDYRLLGVGIRVCIVSAKAFGWVSFSGGCITPSIGISELTYIHSGQRRTFTKTEFGYTKTTMMLLGFKIPFTNFHVTASENNYTGLTNSFPKDCGTNVCPDVDKLEQRSISLIYRFGGHDYWDF